MLYIFRKYSFEKILYNTRLKRRYSGIKFISLSRDLFVVLSKGKNARCVTKVLRSIYMLKYALSTPIVYIGHRGVSYIEKYFIQFSFKTFLSI